MSAPLFERARQYGDIKRTRFTLPKGHLLCGQRTLARVSVEVTGKWCGQGWVPQEVHWDTARPALRWYQRWWRKLLRRPQLPAAKVVTR